MAERVKITFRGHVEEKAIRDFLEEYRHERLTDRQYHLEVDDASRFFGVISLRIQDESSIVHSLDRCYDNA